MAIDVFISYRRSDTGGYAFALHRELQRLFDPEVIFFDGKSIESGMDFPERIEQGVRECKVLLPVIGPDWLEAADAAGRRRLDEPNDFVRREIGLALALGKEVIPVLFAGAEPAPADRLPPELAGLFRKNVHRMSGREHEFNAQLDELVRLIGRIHGVAPPRAPRSASGPLSARKLAVLCDRSLQDTAVCDVIRAQMRAVRATRRPFVIVLHGPADEAHDAFVERLEGYSLPQLLEAGRWGAPVDFLPAFDPLPCNAGQAKFDQRLREAMARALKVPDFGTDDEVIEEIRSNRLGMAVAEFKWSVSEIPCEPGRALDLVFDYWARFPDIPAETLVGCVVSFMYDMRAGGGWLSRLFGGHGRRAEALRAAVMHSATRYGDDARVVWRVLPELPSVTADDLSRWVRRVGDILGGGFHVPQQRLQEIVGGSARPMDEVLPQIEQLIPQF